MEIWYLYFVIVVIAEIIAIYLLTEWSKNEKLYYIILGVLFYILVAVFFALLMKDVSGNKLAIINAIWQVVGLIAITLVGIILFKEKLHYLQWVGIGLTVVALVLLAVGETMNK